MTKYSQAQCAALALQAGVPPSQLQIASAIAMAESGGDSAIVNPGHPGDPEYSVGLWQININSHKQYNATQMKDPQQNAAAMFAISGGGKNWFAWGAYANGSYKQYMTTPLGNVAQLGFLPVPGGKYGPGQATPGQGRSNTTGNPEVTTDVGSGFKWILAYVMAIVIFVLIAKFKAGYAAIYYALVLTLLFLMLTESKFIFEALQPLFTNPSGSGESSKKTVTQTKGVVNA